jgi:hypothetical protein
MEEIKPAITPGPEDYKSSPNHSQEVYCGIGRRETPVSSSFFLAKRLIFGMLLGFLSIEWYGWIDETKDI